MAKSYYSVMLYHPADEVWAVIRPFDHYAWAGVESETITEYGKAGDQVGAVRRVTYAGNIIRQVLIPTPTGSAAIRLFRCRTMLRRYALVRSLRMVRRSLSGWQRSIAPQRNETNG